jgi:predicted esterase
MSEADTLEVEFLNQALREAKALGELHLDRGQIIIQGFSIGAIKDRNPCLYEWLKENK